MWAQSQGNHTIDRLEERGVERGSVQRSVLKGQERVRFSQTIMGTVSEATLGKHLKRWGGAYLGFPEHVDAILNSTEVRG